MSNDALAQKLFANISTEITLKCLEQLDEEGANPILLTSIWHQEINDLEKRLLPKENHNELTELDYLVILKEIELEKYWNKCSSNGDSKFSNEKTNKSSRNACNTNNMRGTNQKYAENLETGRIIRRKCFRYDNVIPDSTNILKNGAISSTKRNKQKKSYRGFRYYLSIFNRVFRGLINHQIAKLR
ncbi:hypothetical protein ACOME3_004073 [Neoechinorhynchus agilis]